MLPPGAMYGSRTLKQQGSVTIKARLMSLYWTAAGEEHKIEGKQGEIDMCEGLKEERD